MKEVKQIPNEKRDFKRKATLAGAALTAEAVQLAGDVIQVAHSGAKRSIRLARAKSELVTQVGRKVINRRNTA